MSTGQLYVVWSTLCRLVKFYMPFGQLYVVWSSFICLLVNLMSSGQVLYVYWSSGQLPYTISEGRPPLRNTSSEAGAPPSEVRIENDSDRKSSKSKFFKVFLETTFVHVSCYPDHYEPKIFFSVFKGHTYASIHDFGLEGSPCNAISEGRPSLRNTSSEAPEARKLRLQRYVSRMYLQSELTEGCKFD